MKKYFIYLLTFFIMIIGFNVNAVENKAVINIDTPNSSNYYGDELMVSGWALSNNPNAKLIVELDGVSSNSTYGWYRSDVYDRSGYGSKSENLTPGYTSIIDLTNIQDGNHVITIKLQDSKEVISQKSITINIQKNKNDASIDAPDVSVSGTNILIGGWALSSAKNAKLNIYINNTKIADNKINRFARKDVLNAIKGYSENSNFNQNCGYDIYYDASNLKDGNYEIKLEITDGTTVLFTKKKTIKLTKYHSVINIDSPSENSKMAGTAIMGGWIMSDCPNYEIVTELDGITINPVINKISRPDVLNAIKGYGGKLLNPTPGFDFKYNIESLTLAPHKLTVSIINPNTHEKIATKDRMFNIKAPTTHLGIDSFVEGQTVTGNNLSISGWVMSEVSNAFLEVYIDNTLINSTISRFKRQDVINAVKDCGNVTENPGYSTVYDVSHFNDGKHTIKFSIKNPTTNQTLYEESRNIKLIKYKGTSGIDSPSTNVKGTQMLIGGWVLSDYSQADLKIYLDDNEVTNISRWKRTDIFNVISGYGGKKLNPNAGFNTTVDLTGIKDGSHIVKIQLFNSQTGEVIHENSKLVKIKKYETTATFDTIQENTTYIGTNLQVGGWIMSTDPNIDVETNIDGIKSTEVKRVSRSDVLSVISGYGGISTNPKPGYDSYIDVSSLSDGKHTVNLIVKDKITGEKIYSLSRTFKLKKYDGKIGIDAPSSAVYNNKVTTDILVGGWALCQQEGSTLEIFIDNVWQNVVIGRYSRSDLSSVSNYGSAEKNPNAGFNATINISHLVTGSHTITIKLYNQNHELVITASKNIELYNNMYPGIDVSQFNGSINWTSVANDGKTFAMIRLGYRGYGSAGKLTVDDKFINNVTNATNSGIRVGLYFFSQATNYQEGVAEADYVIQKIRENNLSSIITYPIAFDTEKSIGYPNGRADNISRQARTEATLGFVRTIAANGFLPIIYASKYWLYDNLDMLQLQGYNVWLAHYTGAPTIMSDYTGTYQMWQYTSSGSVAGITGAVDLDYSFTPYK